jgi:hypothetical protein
MSNSSIVPSFDLKASESPFESIRRFDSAGSEYWLARELMKVLGYAKWERFDNPIQQAIENLELNQDNVFDNIFPLEGSKVTKSGGGDYKLSRYGCYMVALCCEGRKPEVAQAKRYFAVKTREAEVKIPALSEKLENSRLDNESLKLQLEIQSRQDARIALHGLATTLLLEGKSDAVVEIEKPTLEVIDQRNNTSYSGQTLTQIKDFLVKKHGIKFKTGADIKRVLERKGLGHLIAQTPRSVLSDYVPTENQQSVYDALVGTPSRQMLLGE